MLKIQYYAIRLKKILHRNNKSYIYNCLNENSVLQNVYFDIPQGAIKLNCSVAPSFNNRKAIVTIISDDGNLNTLKILDDIFSKYNLKCTVAGIIKRVIRHKNKWLETLRKENVELVNHSFDHIKMNEDSCISKDVLMLDHEISDSFIYLKNNFDIDSICFVCPENVMCQQGYVILDKFNVVAVRKGERGLNSLSPLKGLHPGDWWNLKTYGIMDPGTDLNIRNEWVNSAIRENKWLIEMWHNVAYKDDGCYQTISKDDAEEHLKYIKNKSDSEDIWVANFSEATKYIYEKQHAEPLAYYYEGNIFVRLLFNDNIDKNIFDFPLTLIIDTSNLIDNNKREKIMINVHPYESKDIKLNWDRFENDEK